jgi:ribosomal protein S18 acetylase RimI-like enzyme
MPKKVGGLKIKYLVSDQTELDQIKMLWDGLNRLMGERSTFFKQHFIVMTWAKRKSELLKKAACGLMRIDIAIDELSGEAVGYLVSSVNSEKVGFVESIFVSETCRGIGVGDKLMRNALAWMEQNNVAEKILEVTVGNEQAYGFYGRYGFLPRQTLLKQVKTSQS